MIAVQKDIEFSTNQWVELVCRWEDSEGTPYAITDAWLQVRPSAKSDEVLLEASMENGLISAEAPDWWIIVMIPDSEMEDLNWTGSAEYDLIATREIDGKTDRLHFGQALIVQGVTRSVEP